MRRILATLLLALSAVGAAHAGSQNGAPRTLFESQTLGAGGGGAEVVLSDSIAIPSVGYGMLAIRLSCVTAGASQDSVGVDSTAFEAFLLGKADGAEVDSSGYAPVDLDDSNTRIDGFFCTTLDSSSLMLPGNLTPITGAASTLPKFPFDVSSRRVWGAAVQTASTVAIPGISNIRFGGGPAATHTSVRGVRWFYCNLADAFGGNLRGLKSIRVALLNRNPRIAYSASAYLLPASD